MIRRLLSNCAKFGAVAAVVILALGTCEWVQVWVVGGQRTENDRELSC